MNIFCNFAGTKVGMLLRESENNINQIIQKTLWLT